MKKHLILAFKYQIKFYKSLKFVDYLLLAVLHVFIAWNGIQFLLVPTHINSFIGYNSMMRSINTIAQTQSRIIPLLLFIILSVVILFFMIRNYFEIVYLDVMKSQKQKITNKFNLLINFTIPSFFHNLGIVFIMSSLYLLLLIVYLLLVVMNVHIPVDIFFVKRLSFIYFFSGLVLYNSVSIDFILPEMSKTGSYSSALTKFLKYFLLKKQDIFFFYSLKFFLIAINMVIFIGLINLFIRQPLFRLPLSMSLNMSLINTLTFLSCLFISLIINSVFVQFFNVYCFRFFKLIFRDYARFEYEETS